MDGLSQLSGSTDQVTEVCAQLTEGMGQLEKGLDAQDVQLDTLIAALFRH